MLLSSSYYLLILSSSHPLILSFSHPLLSSSHPLILSSSHPLILSSSQPLSLSSSHPLSLSYSHTLTLQALTLSSSHPPFPHTRAFLGAIEKPAALLEDPVHVRIERGERLLLRHGAARGGLDVDQHAGRDLLPLRY